MSCNLFICRISSTIDKKSYLLYYDAIFKVLVKNHLIKSSFSIIITNKTMLIQRTVGLSKLLEHKNHKLQGQEKEEKGN